MRYVDAGYIVVLGVLFLYGMQLLWRRRRLNRQVGRIESARSSEQSERETT
ncbi:MAG: hypothetical protein ACYCV7_00285 [Acidimicrobiales bacterium]